MFTTRIPDAIDDHPEAKQAHDQHPDRHEHREGPPPVDEQADGDSGRDTEQQEQHQRADGAETDRVRDRLRVVGTRQPGVRWTGGGHPGPVVAQQGGAEQADDRADHDAQAERPQRKFGVRGVGDVELDVEQHHLHRQDQTDHGQSDDEHRATHHEHRLGQGGDRGASATEQHRHQGKRPGAGHRGGEAVGRGGGPVGGDLRRKPRFPDLRQDHPAQGGDHRQQETENCACGVDDARGLHWTGRRQPIRTAGRRPSASTHRRNCRTRRCRQRAPPRRHGHRAIRPSPR